MFTKKRYNILGVLVSAVFLYLLFRGVALDRFVESFYSLNYYIAFVVAVLSLLLVVLKTVRWRWLVLEYEDIPFSQLFAINMLTHFFNIILPFRAGELVQVFATKSVSSLNKTKLTATVILNKFFELASILLVFFVLTFYVKLPENWLLLIKFLIAFVLVFLLLFAFNLITIKEHKGQSIILRKFSELLVAFKMLNNKFLLVKAILFSLFIWAVELVMIEVLLFGFGINVPMWASLLVLSSINLAILIPASNANLGTYEYAVVLALSLFGIVKEEALLFAIALHVLEISLVLLGGAIYYFKFRKYLLKRDADEKEH